MIVYLLISALVLFLFFLGVTERNRKAIEYNRTVYSSCWTKTIVDTESVSVWIGLTASALLWPISLLVFILHCVFSTVADILE